MMQAEQHWRNGMRMGHGVMFELPCIQGMSEAQHLERSSTAQQPTEARPTEQTGQLKQLRRIYHPSMARCTHPCARPGAARWQAPSNNQQKLYQLKQRQKQTNQLSPSMARACTRVLGLGLHTDEQRALPNNQQKLDQQNNVHRPTHPRARPGAAPASRAPPAPPRAPPAVVKGWGLGVGG